MGQEIIINEKLGDKVGIERKILRGLLERLIVHTFGKICMRQGIVLELFVRQGIIV